MKFNLLRGQIAENDGVGFIMRETQSCGVIVSPLVAKGAVTMGRFLAMKKEQLPGFALVIQSIVNAEKKP